MAPVNTDQGLVIVPAGADCGPGRIDACGNSAELVPQPGKKRLQRCRR